MIVDLIIKLDKVKTKDIKRGTRGGIPENCFPCAS